MILHALAELYDRRSRDPDPARRLPAPGFEDKGIPFVVELLPDGRVTQLRDTRRMEGKRPVATEFLVPKGVKRAYGVSANLLWDTAEYVLGVSAKSETTRLLAQTAAFRQRVEALLPHAQDDAGLNAVLAFIAAPNLEPLQASSGWQEMLDTNAVVSFELAGDGGLVCERPAVRAAIEAHAASQDGGDTAPCLIREGRLLPVARLHTSIKGVKDTLQGRGDIVSFNKDAFNSYGKEQGSNASISEKAMFAYTTALNALLAWDSRNKVQVGDATTVFWADSPHEFDGEFTLADLLGEPRPDNPDRGRDAVRALFKAVQSGQRTDSEGQTNFYVLGLAPNMARISVRFWLPRMPFSSLAPRLIQHFDDLRIERRLDSDPETPSMRRLLASISPQGEVDNIPPRLAGEWMRAILENLPLPVALLLAAVQRDRASTAKERKQNPTFPYLRACVLKAWLNRQGRQSASPPMPFKEALDMDNPAPAYRLGRLFATLERIQELAQPGINATIRDRYYGAASTTPVAVFTTLLRLKNAHLKKFTGGQETFYEKLIGDILAPMPEMPRRLTLPQQGEFALGYYHQRQAFFSKKTDADASNDQPQGD